jgi:hypothetical protein
MNARTMIVLADRAVRVFAEGKQIDTMTTDMTTDSRSKEIAL